MIRKLSIRKIDSQLVQSKMLCQSRNCTYKTKPHNLPVIQSDVFFFCLCGNDFKPKNERLNLKLNKNLCTQKLECLFIILLK